MHTTKIKADGWEWILIHNGDWSGDVEIRRSVGTDDAVLVSILPGELLRAACAQMIIGEITGLLEQWDGSSRAIARAKDALMDWPPRRQGR